MFVLLPPSQRLLCWIFANSRDKVFPRVRSVWSSCLRLRMFCSALTGTEIMMIIGCLSLYSYLKPHQHHHNDHHSSGGECSAQPRLERSGGARGVGGEESQAHRAAWRGCCTQGGVLVLFLPGHPHPYNPTNKASLSSNHQSYGHISTIMEIGHKIENYTWRLQLTGAVQRLPTTLKVTLEVKRGSASWRSSPPRCGSWSRSGRSKRRWGFYVCINIFTDYQLTIIIYFNTRWGWGKLS